MLPEYDTLIQLRLLPAAPSKCTWDLNWLRSSYQRAQEQAEEQGKSLEEVVSQRWGVSLHSTWYEALAMICQQLLPALHPPVFEHIVHRNFMALKYNDLSDFLFQSLEKLEMMIQEAER